MFALTRTLAHAPRVSSASREDAQCGQNFARMPRLETMKELRRPATTGTLTRLPLKVASANRLRAEMASAQARARNQQRQEAPPLNLQHRSGLSKPPLKKERRYCHMTQVYQ